MQPLLVTLVACVALIVVYPPAALAIFAVGALVTGWAAWTKARARNREGRGSLSETSRSGTRSGSHGPNDT
jgi:threonine/homoserine/homoserine lactone efflux protein